MIGPSQHRRSVCMWPSCPHFAVTEIREGAWTHHRLDRKKYGWVCLCTKHRRAFDLLSFGLLEQMVWQPRKQRPVG